MNLHSNKKSVLLISMPFAGTTIPSIQLSILEAYLKENNIDVKTRHIYLKAAEFYGLKNYNALIQSPNDSYTAQMIFSKFIFPEHWDKNQNKFKEYFNSRIKKKVEIFDNNFSFSNYEKKTEKIFEWTLKNIEWENYDIIGFTINYGQLFPSLAIAKKIKELNTTKKIILGGTRVIGNIGVKILELFKFIDFVVSGEGEIALLNLVSDYENYKSIPQLIYRENESIIWNKNQKPVNINDQPIMSHDSFFQELACSSKEIIEYFYYFGKLPIEISRGCWWNLCSFCNDKILYPSYKEKKISNIINEINYVSDRYKILNFQMIGETLPLRNYVSFFEEIKKQGKDYSFFVEARAGRLNSEDFKKAKEAGFDVVQIGIESFSRSYLNKINKGVRVIDNIAALKFARENDVRIDYNLLINYPNEDINDFDETKKNIQLIKQYLDPPSISYLTIAYGSTIYEKFDEYNIEHLEPCDIDKIMFPKDLLDKGLNYFYHFKRRKSVPENDWIGLVNQWKKIKKKFELNAIENNSLIDKFVFYFLDGGNFIKIFDKRDFENIKIYVLDELERKVFISCLNVISFEELLKKLSDIQDHELAAILHTFEQKGIVFKEENRYLSLPLKYSQKTNKTSDVELENEIYVSGNDRSL